MRLADSFGSAISKQAQTLSYLFCCKGGMEENAVRHFARSVCISSWLTKRIGAAIEAHGCINIGIAAVEVDFLSLSECFNIGAFLWTSVWGETPESICIYYHGFVL